MVHIETFQPENKLKQSLDDFIHVGGMTLAIMMICLKKKLQ